MTNIEFQELCRSTCYALDVPESDALDDGKGVLVDGVTVGAFYDEESDEGIHFYVDLGPVEPMRQAEVFEEMLSLNLELGGWNDEAICYERESGHLVLRACVPLKANINEQDMVGWFKEYTSLVNELREGILA